MEKDFPSTQKAVSTQGSCPAQDRASLPSPIQIPPSLVSSNIPAAPSNPTKSPSSTEHPKSSYPTHPFPHTVSAPADSQTSSESESPAVSSHPTSKTVPTKPSSPDSDEKTHVFPHHSSAQIPKPPSFSKLSCASSTSASLARDNPTDSALSSSIAASTMPPATSSNTPVKRTFASMAKQVIMQERLRKAEEADGDDDEEDGKMIFILSLR